jgi:formate dehydrogenase iron-sulfur subunit
VRSEYPHAIATMNEAIAIATERGYLGDDILGSGKSFRLEVRKGAGAYICGEETAMLESLEGKRGVVRAKPPLPAIEGLFGKPTVINNLISLASVPVILARGADFYKNYGVGRSRHAAVPAGWQHQARRPGGEGVRPDAARAAGRLRRRQCLGTSASRGADGRAAGRVPAASQFDTPLDYEAFAAIGAMIGHGGLVALTTVSIWPNRPATPCSSVPSNPVASARPAASAPRAAWK